MPVDPVVTAAIVIVIEAIQGRLDNVHQNLALNAWAQPSQIHQKFASHGLVVLVRVRADGPRMM